MTRREHVLVMHHDRGSSAGVLAEWLARRGAQVQHVLVSEIRRLPDPGCFDLVVAMGSELCAADDRLQWLASERAFLAAAHKRAVPLLGICFGAQLLARALGGAVHQSAVCEIGWRELEDRGGDLAGSGSWFEWHFDTFEAPPGASVLAESAAGQEAYRLGRSLGVQFHPEVDGLLIEDWMVRYGDEMTSADIDATDLLFSSDNLAAAARARSHDFFDRVAVEIDLAATNAC